MGYGLSLKRLRATKTNCLNSTKKLRTLTFFDPACGCGNFLVISYRELRALELAVLRASNSSGQLSVDVHQLIGIDVDQFYGIEIEEFPAQIAQVAMWLMDHQANLQVSEEFGLYFARIPLRTSPHVVHGNALQLDWNDVLPAQRCSYVLGNPPFIGYSNQSTAQKADSEAVFKPLKNGGTLDFVTAWYVKATNYLRSDATAIAGQSARVAFVSTNSITQGEQVAALWSWLFAQGIYIHFAHRTFRWSNEASGKAAVHCVIIGLGLEDSPGKVIYEYADVNGEPHPVPVAQINPYLIDAPFVAIEKRRDPICKVPGMSKGSQPTDNGNLLLTDAEKDALLAVEPAAKPFVRPMLSAHEFLHNEKRWCLWLVGANPTALKACPEVMRRVQSVRDFRLKSTKALTREQASTPAVFSEIRQPESHFLLIPRHSSENRTYVPFGFFDASYIVSDSCSAVPDATLLHFGTMSSAMHMAWVRYTCGRIKSDFRYSNTIVYNNYPWPEFPQNSKPNQPVAPVHPAQAAIETAAQTVLDVRAKFQSGDQPATLADLYDPLTMPPELLKAHQKLDAAVDKAYEASGGKKSYKSDAERVAFLFELYQKYTSLLPAAPAKAKRKTATTK
jgi:hypothetical protein